MSEEIGGGARGGGAELAFHGGEGIERAHQVEFTTFGCSAK
jgi:hypothetical protein